MSMQVKPGYTNPLLMMKDHGKSQGWSQGTGVQKGTKEKVKELQVKQQQLQSQMMLMKATGTDGGGTSAKTLEKMETRLDEVTADLRTAKRDSYVKEDKKEESAGIYQVRQKHGERIVEINR